MTKTYFRWMVWCVYSISSLYSACETTQNTDLGILERNFMKISPNFPGQPAQPAPRMLWQLRHWGSITRQAIGQAQFSVRHVPTACSRGRCSSAPQPTRLNREVNKARNVLWSTLLSHEGKKNITAKQCEYFIYKMVVYKNMVAYLSETTLQHHGLLLFWCFCFGVKYSTSLVLIHNMIWSSAYSSCYTVTNMSLCCAAISWSNEPTPTHVAHSMILV